MIDPKSDESEKLSQARQLFRDAVDHYEDCNARRHLVSKFFHNTLGTGQWLDEDRKYLEDQKRPVLSFNVARPKVQTAIGMHKEQQRRAVVRPVGAEDKMLAEVLGSLSRRVHAKAGSKVAASTALTHGYVKGEGDTAVEVTADPKNPARVLIELSPASPYEVRWDPGSTRRDRRDASYVTWDRWLSKTEFKQEYPDYEDSWDELEKGSREGELLFGQDGTIAEGQWDESDDYSGYSSYFYDRHQKRARVVRIEYRVLQRNTFGRINGSTVELDDEEVDALKRANSVGLYSNVTLEYTNDQVVHALEICGVKILYDSATEEDGKPPNPFDGYSIEPYIWADDDEAGFPYGMMNDLIDPVMEINKAWSSSLEHTVGQEQPGHIAEEGAVDDPKKFRTELATRGSVAIVRDGSLSGQRIQRREVPQPSAAAQQRLSNSFEVIDRVSGFTADLERPAAMNEPATSVAIRYHKSQLALFDARESFDDYLVNIERRIIQAITRAMPDEQIQEMLSNDEKYLVQHGQIIELMPHPQNPEQKIPAGPPRSLRDLRAMAYDIELDTTTENTTLRTLKVDQWSHLLKLGVPIPPDLIAESATDSRSERERLRTYAEEQGKVQATQAKEQSDEMTAQVRKTLEIEAAKVMEKSRHDRAQEALQAQKQASDAAVDVATVLERADTDEKRALLELVKVLEQRQRERAQQTGVQGVPGIPGGVV